MLFLLSIGLLLGKCDSAAVTQDLFKLDIIHYNDFHARFEETSLSNSICRTNNNECLGGFPRLFHLIKTLLAQKPYAILLNAGDNFQGTYWFTTLKGSITDQFLNMLPHDAHGASLAYTAYTSFLETPQKPDAIFVNAGNNYQGTYWFPTLKVSITDFDGKAIGNHEFDDGPATLAEFISKLKAPVLVANMDTSKEPSLQGKYKHSTIVERKGRKIGIIGLITEDLSMFLNIGKVVITSASEAIRREALALKERGVDIVIVLSHCGFDVDRQLAKDHSGLIDVIVGGHSHSLLWNGKAPSGEPVAAPYPTILEGDNKVLIVQASAFTKYMGNLTVYFDGQGNYVEHEGDAIFLDRSIPEDTQIKEKLQPYASKVHEAEQQIVGENANAMHFEDCTFGECALGDLLTDAMVEYAKDHVDSKIQFIAFNQRGNIRANIEKGKITKGVIFELLPYSDRIQHFEVKGKQIREALEISVSGATSIDPFSGPLVLQFSGLQVTYNMALAEGQRVTSVFVGGKGSTNPLSDDQTYHVLGPRFWWRYPMFKNKVNPQDVGKDFEVFEAYVKKHTPLNIRTDGRIAFVKK